jgi:adenylate cyclase
MLLIKRKFAALRLFHLNILSACLWVAIFLVFFPFLGTARGQVKEEREVDSLERALSKQRTDTAIINVKILICNRCAEFNTDSGIKYGLEALAEAQKAGWSRGIARAYRFIGKNYYKRSEYEKSIMYFNKSIDLFTKIGDKLQVAKVLYDLGESYKDFGKSDSMLIAHKAAFDIIRSLDTTIEAVKMQLALGYNFYGVYYMEKGTYNESYAYLFKGLQLFEELKDVEYVTNITSNIGQVCFKLKDYKNALSYFSKALIANAQKKDSVEMAKSFLNIANVFNEQKKYDSALQNHFKALAIFRNRSPRWDNAASRTLVAIGDVYKNKGNFPEALDKMFEGLGLAQKSNDKESEYNAEGDIGEVYLMIASDTTGSIKEDKFVKANKVANFKKAIEYLQKAIIGLRELSDIEGIQYFSKLLSEAHRNVGDYREALESFLEYTAIKDSIFSKEKNEALIKLQTEREKQLAEKQIEIDRLEVEKKKKAEVYSYIGMAIMLVIIGLVVKNNVDQKKSNTIIVKEKKRSDELLLNILPSEVAEELKDKGSADAKFFEQVTVLFTDFVGFTKVSEKLTPQELVNELDGCFKGFDGIMGKYGIEKIKTVGDAYLAVCGLPAPDSDHAEKVVLAALEIRDFMVERKKVYGERTFDVRIGVHTGSVVAGIVGVKKFAYDIWGDTVNTAARMEQNSVAMHINISNKTYLLVKDKFHLTYRGEIQAKNKGELSMYFVDGKIEKETV